MAAAFPLWEVLCRNAACQPFLWVLLEPGFPPDRLSSGLGTDARKQRSSLIYLWCALTFIQLVAVWGERWQPERGQPFPAASQGGTAPCSHRPLQNVKLNECGAVLLRGEERMSVLLP